MNTKIKPMRLLFSLLLIMGLCIQANLPHEFHFSKCQIEYQADTQALQISMHLFIDDVELALEKRGYESLFLCTEREHPDANKHLLDYLESSFQLAINDKAVAYQFVGKEITEDLSGMWCYFEIEKLKKLKTLEIRNSILTEIHDDQKNVLQVQGPSGNKAYSLLDKEHKKERLEFGK